MLSGEEKVVNSDPEKVNLEHIMPKQSNQYWNQEQTGIESELRSIYVNRLGNMALVSKDKNKRVGSKSFEEKKHQLFSLQTEFSLTESISEFDKGTKILLIKGKSFLRSMLSKHGV